MKKKLIGALLVLVLAVTFVGAAMVSTTEARPPCIATCLNGYWWVCCPDGHGHWFCCWDGPCYWY